MENSTPFDDEIQQLLVTWQAKLGNPTCGAGCSMCCQNTTVIVSPPEALRLLDYLNTLPTQKANQVRKEWETRMTVLHQNLKSNMDEGIALNALLDLGGCVFLDENMCGVYAGRPDTCRSFYVWHEATKCGQAEFDMCSPAELRELRIRHFYDVLLEESAAGRVPFWGQLLIMVGLMDQYRHAYQNGVDLNQQIDPVWLQTGLVHFIKPEGSLVEIVTELKTEQADFARLFAEEPWPFGQPKLADVKNRSDLNAFPLDIEAIKNQGVKTL